MVKMGVKATIIDFTLSRALPGENEKVLAGGLEDETLFAGEGDYQYECYRMMKELVKDDWEKYRPLTNVVVRIQINKKFTACSADNVRFSGFTTYPASYSTRKS